MTAAPENRLRPSIHDWRQSMTETSSAIHSRQLMQPRAQCAPANLTPIMERKVRRAGISRRRAGLRPDPLRRHSRESLMPKRIQFNRFDGFPKPVGAVLVNRPYRWGNPYPVKVYGRDEALRLFEHVFMTPERRAAAKIELRGHDLGCLCRLDQPCHADVLLRIVNTDD